MKPTTIWMIATKNTARTDAQWEIGYYRAFRTRKDARDEINTKFKQFKSIYQYKPVKMTGDINIKF
ncbi:MAG TPA: hypothetical protein VFM18_24625 [Methanosarcina sp.]|nr:hypothetical protein [Methanosarcina sp.]